MKGQRAMTRHYFKEEMMADREDDSLFEHYTLVATAGQKPLRVDKFLANLLPFTTRSKIKNASQTGSITVNDKAVKVSFKVKAGDVVRLMLPFPPPPELVPEEIPLDIRFEDDDLMMIHKPPNMVCHPAHGHRSGTLVHGLLWHFEHLPHKKGEEKQLRPGLVHRIDKNTSGLMVIAKSEYALAHLSKQFFDHTTDRSYIALVWGDVQEDQGTVEAHVGRHNKERKIYKAYPDGSAGKHAVTHYKVLERFGVVTLIQCKLETGRTHQIRVHMKSIGHTLFNDDKYGGDKVLKGPLTRKYKQFIKNCFDLMPRQALHAKSLGFEHPTKKERVHFDTEIPEDFHSVLEKLRAWVKT